MNQLNERSDRDTFRLRLNTRIFHHRGELLGSGAGHSVDGLPGAVTWQLEGFLVRKNGDEKKSNHLISFCDAHYQLKKKWVKNIFL